MTVIDLNCPVFTVFDGATDQKKALWRIKREKEKKSKKRKKENRKKKKKKERKRKKKERKEGRKEGRGERKKTLKNNELWKKVEKEM